MKVKFKYNVGDVVTLINKPSDENTQLGYIHNDEFTPKEYKIEKCLCKIIGTEEPKILYNLDAYCDEYIQFHNWIPEDDLSGTINEHEEDVEFISHDKEILSIGDDVIASAFYGDYENSVLSPSLTFTYVGTIIGLMYEINGFKKKSYIRRAIVERNDGTNHAEITPYLVKKMDENFAFEYVKFCKRDRFNPIKESEKQYSHNKKFLEEIHLWDKVLEIYKNWNKYRKDGKVTEKKKTVKKEKPKADINKLLNSLSEDEINELKKKLLEK